jgi:hypothetical protein
MPNGTTQWLTPPQLAAQMGIDPGKVLLWIQRGDLAAVNCASLPTGRPRWRISAEALQDFERRRSARPTPRQPRRRRRAMAESGDFF